MELPSINQIKTVSLNELLPIERKITEIQTGSELLLAYELGKYARILLDRRLVLSDVTISNDLLNGEIFSFVVNNGLDVGFDYSMIDLVIYKAQLFFTGTIESVVFKEESPDRVVFDYEHDINANRFIRGDNRSAAYVSLFAFLVINSIKNGANTPKLVINPCSILDQEMWYADLLVLQSYGNKILENLLEVWYYEDRGFQPDWEAFVVYHRQRGLMNREYTTTEKFNYLKDNFEVGDVVLLYKRIYKRKADKKGNRIGILKGCYPAVIKNFDRESVAVTYYPDVFTKLTRKTILDEVERKRKSDGLEPYYTWDDYNRFTKVEEKFAFTEIGVDAFTYDEAFFFIKPTDSDGSYQYLEKDKVMWLSTLDTIYAVFEDHKDQVSYNKEKFLQEYFYSKNRRPIYPLPKRGGKRAGAGRKSLGVKKPVSITLPDEVWNEIDNLIQNGDYKSYADYFRSLAISK